MALADKISTINTLKKELDGLLPVNKDSEKKLWQKFRMEWNYNSNHIEGNTLTYGETKLLILFDKTTGDHELREFEEMKAHDVAIHLVKNWSLDKERDLVENNIRELNQTILVKPFWKAAQTKSGENTRRLIKVGDYKDQPNSVITKTGEIFDYTSPEETPIKMAELMLWYQSENSSHPIIKASQLHYDFIRIHPFDDGNGRVARLLVNYVLMRHSFPPIIIKSAEKDKYLTALNKADIGDIDAFHEYMAEQLIWSLEISLKAAKGESIDELGDFDKKLSLFNKKVKENSNYTETVKNLNIQENIFFQFVIPLFKILSLNLEKFNNYFTEYQLNCAYYIDRTGERKDFKFDDTPNQINELINSIQYSYELVNFKSTKCSFKVIINCYFTFEIFKYKMGYTIQLVDDRDTNNNAAIYNSENFQSSYNQEIHSGEINIYSEKIASDVLSLIESKA